MTTPAPQITKEEEPIWRRAYYGDGYDGDQVIEVLAIKDNWAGRPGELIVHYCWGRSREIEWTDRVVSRSGLRWARRSTKDFIDNPWLTDALDDFIELKMMGMFTPPKS